MSEIKLKIRCSTGKDYNLSIINNITIIELKNQIEKEFNIPANTQKLIYRGRILQDDKNCLDYNIQNEQTIHLVQSKLNKNPTTNNNINSNPTNNTLPPDYTFQPPPINNNPLGFNPYNMQPPNGMFDQQYMRQQTEEMMKNPELIRQMMDNPMVQSMLSNPDVMENMFNSNPQVKQLMEEHPELSQVINDPSLMQQTMELMKNPDTMRELLRSQDQAMRNIESIPGGFDALRRLYSVYIFNYRMYKNQC